MYISTPKIRVTFQASRAMFAHSTWHLALDTYPAVHFHSEAAIVIPPPLVQNNTV
jgi:hypothetical protein